MIHNTDIYATRCIKTEWTEDGDKLFVWEVRAKGFAGVRAYNAERTNQINSRGFALEPLTEWTACGDGWLRTTFTHVVDGVEIAIEARNDAWASEQQDIEDRYVGRF